MKQKIRHYLLKNIGELKDTTVFITGGTGSIGRCIVEQLLFLHVQVIIGVRNPEKGMDLISQMKQIYPYSKIKMIPFDLNDWVSTGQGIDELKRMSPDYVIFNHAVSKKRTINSYGIEEHFFVNVYAPYFVMRELGNQICYIGMGSVCCKKEIRRWKKGTRIKDDYAYSKSLFMQLCYQLKKDNSYEITLVHPGISYTDLFCKRHEKIKYLLKIGKPFLIRNEMAALSVLWGIQKKNINLGEWIAPRGIKEGFGYPKVKKMDNRWFEEEYLEQVKVKIEETNQKMEEKR